jgi:glutamyl-Q tRNA(Asp) synthetase
MHDSNSKYRGRFAPSPTGPLHFGSLVAAVGSYLEACGRGGCWFVRIEDLDPPREIPGAADAILRALEAYGFEWDGEIMFQSRRADAYRAALAALRRSGAVFPCACSRREVADLALAPVAETIYPGTCRYGLPSGRTARVVRVRVEDAVIGFDDALQGRVEQNLALEVGDFVVRRTDGLFAYQLAVVVDDFEQGITDVVRGADLLASTPRQLFLQRLMSYSAPKYAHLPVAVDRNGEKLSKQTLASPLPVPAESRQLWRALRFLGQDPPQELAWGSIARIWEWAFSNWRMQRIPRRQRLPETEAG